MALDLENVRNQAFGILLKDHVRNTVLLKLAVVVPSARVDRTGTGVDLLLGWTLHLVALETTLALELVVGIAKSVFFELEQLAQVL